MEFGPLPIPNTADTVVATYLGAASNTTTERTVAVERRTDGAYVSLQGYSESGLLTLTSSSQVVYSYWLRVIGAYLSNAVPTSFVAVPGTQLPVPVNIPASSRDSLVLAVESGDIVALPTTNPVIPWFGMPPDGLSTATVWHYNGTTGTYHQCRSRAILRHPAFYLRHIFPVLVVQVIIPNLIDGFVSPTVRHLVDSKTVALLRPNGLYDFGLIQKNDQLAFVCTTPGMYTIHWLPGNRIVARDTFHYPIQHSHTPPGNYAITVWGSQLAAEEGTARSEGGYDHVLSSKPIAGGVATDTRSIPVRSVPYRPSRIDASTRPWLSTDGTTFTFMFDLADTAGLNPTPHRRAKVTRYRLHLIDIPLRYIRSYGNYIGADIPIIEIYPRGSVWFNVRYETYVGSYTNVSQHYTTSHLNPSGTIHLRFPEL